MSPKQLSRRPWRLVVARNSGEGRQSKANAMRGDARFRWNVLIPPARSSAASRDLREPYSSQVHARGSDLEEGESEGLPVWSRHVGDSVLASNLTRRTDFALFMVEALVNDELIHEAPAIVGRLAPSAQSSAHAPALTAARH